MRVGNDVSCLKSYIGEDWTVVSELLSLTDVGVRFTLIRTTDGDAVVTKSGLDVNQRRFSAGLLGSPTFSYATSWPNRRSILWYF